MHVLPADKTAQLLFGFLRYSYRLLLLPLVQ
jgi:hypothetical protein